MRTQGFSVWAGDSLLSDGIATEHAAVEVAREMHRSDEVGAALQVVRFDGSLPILIWSTDDEERTP